MVRAPCRETMGLKRGPWTPEEDRVLVSYIQRYGHSNWRALPRQAGLLRCGKSCRLRWTNYLRPDIRRGNFTTEEDEAIVKLHEMLGNRWSAIAAQLPGRTDNEIKNVWHTRLKRRLPQPKSNAQPIASSPSSTELQLLTVDSRNSHGTTSLPQSSSSSSEFSYFSSVTGDINSCESATIVDVKEEEGEEYKESTTWEEISQLDDSRWSEALSLDDCFGTTSMNFDDSTGAAFGSTDRSLFSNYAHEHDDDMDFWLKLLIQTGDLSSF